MIKRIAIIENNVLATNTIRKKLTLSLIENGYDVLVLTTGEEPEMNAVKSAGIPIENIGAGGVGLKSIYNYIVRLNKSIRNFNPDVVLTFTIRPNIWGNFIAGFLNKPVISNITGIGALFSRKKFGYTIARTLLKYALQKTKWIFFQNEDDRNLFLSRKLVHIKNTQVIPGSGVDVHFFKPSINEKVNDELSFLFIGRLIKDKGIIEYCEAALSVLSSYPKVKFKIVGPFWNQNFKSNSITQSDLKKYQQAGIEYLGDTDDVRPFIENADVVVLPSYREGMSNVLLESGSMAKPCIASNVTGCKEIIDHGVTGFLCKAKDANDLAGMMIKMIKLSHAERTKMGKAAREKIKTQFNKQIVVDAYLSVLHKLDVK